MSISLIVIHANAYSHDDRYTSALGPPLFNPGRCSPFLQASRVTCTEIRQNSRADRGNVTAFTPEVGIAHRRFVIHRFAFDFCTGRRPGSLDVSIDARERERESSTAESYTSCPRLHAHALRGRPIAVRKPVCVASYSFDISLLLFRRIMELSSHTYQLKRVDNLRAYLLL